MTRLILAVCLAMAATLCLSVASEAHKVNIFAYVDGNKVVTDSGYSRTRRVHDGVVEVRDAATDAVLLTGRTDTSGKFEFEIPEQARADSMDLRLLLKAGAGHQAEWIVKYSEYGEGDGPLKTNAPGHVHKTVFKAVRSEADVEAIVRRELEPVKRMLVEMKQGGPSVTEVVGGLGYIFGLFGLVAFLKSRKKDNE